MILVPLRRTIVSLSMVLSAGWVLAPAPASAQFGLPGAIFGAAMGAFGGIGRGGRVRQPRVARQPRVRREVIVVRESRGSRRTNTEREGGSSATDSAVLASLAPSSKQQVVVLKSIYPSAALGVVGVSQETKRVGETTTDETKRDDTAAISDLINRFKQAAQKATREGDITQHSIQLAVEEAYKKAGLQRFESFVGENWSSERLKVMIFNRVDSEIGSLLEGTNRGQVQMAELSKIVDRAAVAVYARLFETSELLAANRSATLFFQRLYQVHGDLASGELGDDAEHLLSRASATATKEFDPLMRRDDNGYALRYRIKRIVFDCLTDNVERITAAESGLAQRDEVEQRIGDVGRDECSAWVSHQFKGADGRLKPQEPMPLRAGWSADGPKDDPTMYGGSSRTM